MKYRETWDLSTIPEDKLKAEWGRRNARRRSIFAGGRPPKISTCPKCNLAMSARQGRTHRCLTGDRH